MSIKDLNVSQYNSKYLKYKNKYLNLIKMIGGGNSSSAPLSSESEKITIHIGYVSEKGISDNMDYYTFVVFKNKPLLKQILDELNNKEYMVNDITIFNAETFSIFADNATLSIPQTDINLIVYNDRSKAFLNYLRKLEKTTINSTRSLVSHRKIQRIKEFHLGKGVGKNGFGLENKKAELNLILTNLLHIQSTVKVNIDYEDLSMDRIQSFVTNYENNNFQFIEIKDKNNIVIKTDLDLFIAYERDKYYSNGRTLIFTLFIQEKQAPNSNQKREFTQSNQTLNTPKEIYAPHVSNSGPPSSSGWNLSQSPLTSSNKKKLIITYINYYDNKTVIEIDNIEMGIVDHEFIAKLLSNKNTDVDSKLITVFLEDKELTNLSNELVKSKVDVIKLTVYHNHSGDLIKKLFFLNKNKENPRIKKLIEEQQTAALGWNVSVEISFNEWLFKNKLGPYSSSSNTVDSLVSNARPQTNSTHPQFYGDHVLASELWKEDSSHNQNQSEPKKASAPLELQMRSTKSFNQGPSNLTQPPLPSFGNAGTSNNNHQQISQDKKAVQEQLKNELKKRKTNDDVNNNTVNNYFKNNPYCIGKCIKFQNSVFGPEIDDRGRSYLERTQGKLCDCQVSNL